MNPRRLTKDIESLLFKYLSERNEDTKSNMLYTLKGCIEDLFNVFPHENKFLFSYTSEIISKSIDYIDNYDVSKAASAFYLLSLYAQNIYCEPWRKEFHEIKLYSGFFKHNIKDCIYMPERFLKFCGYTPSADGESLLLACFEKQIFAKFVLEAIFAMTECEIMERIYNRVKKVSLFITMHDVSKMRQSYVGSAEEMIDMLITGHPIHSAVEFPPIVCCTTKLCEVEKRTSRKLDKVSEEVMKKAVLEVENKGLQIRKVAAKYGIVHVTLFRYVKKYRACKNAEEEKAFAFRPRYDVNKVFDKEMEDMIFEYLIKASKILYGLTLKQCMKFVYQLAKANRLKYPPSWDRNESAGEDWMKIFRKNYPRLSIRKPESTSLARATAFNKTTVTEFFENLEWAYNELKQLAGEVRPNAIYNLDETGLTNVQTPRNILAEKGEKQVSQATSAERGILVTACCFINALGNSLPPFMVFPRVFFKNYFLQGAPTGTDGCGTKNASGWMNGEAFMNAMEHFRKFSNCSKSNPVLLIFDNHESHITIDSLNFFKNNGIIVVTLPPHTSQRLQPLDRCVYGPLKTAYNTAINDHMITNAGKTVTMHDIACLFGKVYDQTFSAKNIKSGFEKCGIYPMNRNIFSDSDFNFAFVTDRDKDANAEVINQENGADLLIPFSEDHRANELSKIEISALTLDDVTPSFKASTSSSRLTPEEVRPFKKASPRKKSTRARVKSLVLTRTPVKNELESKLTIRKQKKEITEKRKLHKKVNRSNYESDSSACGEPTARKKLNFVSKRSRSTNEKSKATKNNNSNSDSVPDLPVVTSSSEIEEFSENEFSSENIVKDRWVLVKYFTEHKQNEKNFIGQVLQQTENRQFQVKSARKRGEYFYWPEIEDVGTYEKDNIISVLPNPMVARRNRFKFPVAFTNFNIY